MSWIQNFELGILGKFSDDYILFSNPCGPLGSLVIHVDMQIWNMVLNLDKLCRLWISNSGLDMKHGFQKDHRTYLSILVLDNGFDSSLDNSTNPTNIT